MLCILKLRPPTDRLRRELKYIPGDEISGWIIATDLHDARRQAQAAGENALASAFNRMEFAPRPGIYPLETGHVLLVS